MGAEAVADVFDALARMETEHLAALERRTEGWRSRHRARTTTAGSRPGLRRRGGARVVLRLMTPHSALAIALGAEKRAQAFFEFVLR